MGPSLLVTPVSDTEVQWSYSYSARGASARGASARGPLQAGSAKSGQVLCPPGRKNSIHEDVVFDA